MSVQDHELPLNQVADEGEGAQGSGDPHPEAVDSWWDTEEDHAFEVEDTIVGPQGVLIPKDPYVDPNAPISQLVADDEEFESPEVRAQTRFSRLSTAFSSTLVIVGQMYRDEDWRYLRKPDGSEYKSLVEVCQIAMGKSVAMARRYVQGARDFYLPLSAIMVEGTRLEITSGDIATLGTDGIRQVVDDASERLQGVDDPEEATGIINDSLSSAREERERGRRESESSSSDWDDSSPREYYEQPEPDASGPVYTYTGEEDDDDAPGMPGAAPTATTQPEPEDSYFGDAEDDLIAPLLTDAPLFDDDSELDRLPIAVKRIVRAMLVLEKADVAEITHFLNYENRGIIVHSDHAQKALARIRSMAETQPWVMKGLEQPE